MHKQASYELVPHRATYPPRGQSSWRVKLFSKKNIDTNLGGLFFLLRLYCTYSIPYIYRVSGTWCMYTVVWKFEVCFSSHLIILTLLSQKLPPFCNSDPRVTQQCTPPPSPMRCVPSLLSRERVQPFRLSSVFVIWNYLLGTTINTSATWLQSSSTDPQGVRTNKKKKNCAWVWNVSQRGPIPKRLPKKAYAKNSFRGYYYGRTYM